MSEPTPARETLSYELFGTAARELAGQVADDVADTGKTLELVREFCAGCVAAVLYEKPRSTVRCDSVWRRADRWTDFPWSTLPPVRRRPGAPAR